MTAADPRLDEIEGRLNAATPGPWEWDDRVRRALTGKDGAGVLKCAAILWPDAPDAEFIAAAPADVAYLLAELRKAQDGLARVEALAAEWEELAGSGSDWERVYGKQKVSVDHAVARIRAAVADANGDGE